jgi:hypothetical protein
MFECLECGRKLRSTKAAARAAWTGCPGCGGVDIDLASPEPPAICFPPPTDPPTRRGKQPTLFDEEA